MRKHLSTPDFLFILGMADYFASINEVGGGHVGYYSDYCSARM